MDGCSLTFLPCLWPPFRRRSGYGELVAWITEGLKVGGREGDEGLLAIGVGKLDDVVGLDKSS